MERSSLIARSINIADHSVFKCKLTPFRLSLLNMSVALPSLLCTGFLMTEQPVLDHITMT